MFTMIRARDGSLSFQLQQPPALLSPEDVDRVLFALMPVLVDLLEARQAGRATDAENTDATATTVVAAVRRPSEPMWQLWASLLLANEKHRLRRTGAPPAEVHARLLEMSQAVWRRLVECDLPREETLRLARLAQTRLREELLELVDEDPGPTG